MLNLRSLIVIVIACYGKPTSSLECELCGDKYLNENCTLIVGILKVSTYGEKLVLKKAIDFFNETHSLRVKVQLM